SHIATRSVTPSVILSEAKNRGPDVKLPDSSLRSEFGVWTNGGCRVRLKPRVSASFGRPDTAEAAPGTGPDAGRARFLAAGPGGPGSGPTVNPRRGPGAPGRASAGRAARGAPRAGGGRRPLPARATGARAPGPTASSSGRPRAGDAGGRWSS